MTERGQSEFDYTFKVTILGVSGVGISTFLKKYATEVFESIPIYKKVFIRYKIIREISKNNTESKIFEDINKVYQEILNNYRNLYSIHKDSRIGIGFKFRINIDTHCEPLTFHFMQNWAEFTCEDSINTQPASDFVKTHATVIEIIEVFKKYGFDVEIFDDTNYYKTKNIDLLSGKNREIDRLEKVGLEYYTKILEINNKTFKIQIWRPILKTIRSICQGSNVALIMYDITNSNSLKQLPDWLQIIRENAGDIPIILIGNKIDFEISREVSKEAGIKFAEKYNLSAFIEISTKTGQNVEKVFTVLTEIIINSLK